MNTVQNRSISPAALLASLKSGEESPPELAFVTGGRGAGKTRWCDALVNQARSAGLDVAGLLSPAVFDSESKVGIDLVDLSSHERRCLALRRSDPNSRVLSGPHTAGWQFDRGALEWGNDLLSRLPACDLLILDELGPLELLENQGLFAALPLVERRQYQLACVVVRPLLLATAQERWPWGFVLDLSGSSSA